MTCAAPAWIHPLNLVESLISRKQTRVSSHERRRRVTSDEFHDAMLVLNKTLERTHARVVDADMRAFTAQRETQIILGRIQAYLDARPGLEDRVTRCEDDIAALKDRAR